VSSHKLCERPAAARVFPPTEEFLIRCVTHAFGGDEVGAPPSEIDWSRFTTLAGQEGVLPWLDSTAALTSVLPSHVLDAARREHTTTIERNLLLSAELVRVLAHFRQNGVEALAFKGVIAAIQFYGGLADRPTGDLDLLVRRRDYPRACQILTEAGYKPDIEYPASLQRVFSHSSKGTVIDMHWGLPPIGPRFSERTVWRHRTHLALIGSQVPTFDNATATAVIAINAVKVYWNVSLRQHIDVMVSLKRLNSDDWRTVLRRARQIGCLHFVLAATYVADRLFPNTLPAHVRSDTRRVRVAALIGDEVIQHLFERSRSAPSTRVFATRSDYNLALDSRRIGRYVDRVRHAITPNAADKAWVALPEHLGSLYYVLRPLRLLLIGRRRNLD
jgi:hypothetical protein